MSKFTDALKDVLAGGLPALLDDPTDDGGVATPTAGDPPARVEETAPVGTIADREPFLQTVTQSQILIGTAGILGILALIMLVRR